MLLAVDVGNTNTVFALFDGEQPKADWRIATDTRRTADQYFVWFDHLMMIGGYGRAMRTLGSRSAIQTRARLARTVW